MDELRSGTQPVSVSVNGVICVGLKPWGKLLGIVCNVYLVVVEQLGVEPGAVDVDYEIGTSGQSHERTAVRVKQWH